MSRFSLAKPFRRWWLPLLVGVILGAVQPVLAHGYLLRSIPEDHAVLERSPARLQYWFSEPLEPDFSSLIVRDQAGNTIASGGVPEENLSLLTVRLPRALADGAYIVDMRLAFASDGHVVAQSRVFFIGQAVGGVAGQAASDQANTLEVVWRAIMLASTMLLFGAFTLYAGVLVPAWGNPDYRVGLLPPRVMRRLSWIIGGALVVAIFANILALLQQSMVFFNADLGQVISGGLWSVTRAGTRFGDLWTARMLLMALVAAGYGLSLYFREEQPETVRPFWTASAWAMALVIGAFSAGSHAAGSLVLPWVAVAMDWLHALAVGFWVGGLGALVLVLPVALAPYQGDSRRMALLAVLRRFSRLAVGCLAVVVTTGIYSATNWINTPSELTGTTYGGALVVKLVLVAGLLLVGLAHHVAVQPERYRRWSEVARRVSDFIPTLRLEAVLVVVIMLIVGWLTATPVPVPDFVQESLPPPSQTQTLGDYELTMTITPGGPGVNTYDILVTRDGQTVDGLDVRAQIASPSRDRRGGWQTAEDADAGLYIAAGAEIDQPGGWWSLVDIDDRNGSIQRAAFDWTISPDAAIEQSRPPNLANLLALAGVVMAVGWLLYPPARRLYARLDLSPAAVTAAVMAILAGIFLSVVGFILVSDTQAQYDATLNPPPTITNPTLPDAASLERGRALYAADCPAWEASSDFGAFTQRLPRARDQELFLAVRDGWRGLPACAPMTDAERWDVVNYVRTLGNET